MKEFMCNKLGHSCNAVLKAGTEEQLLDMAAVHLREKHGIVAVLPDLAAKMKNLFINRSTVDAAKVVDRIFETYQCSGEPDCTWRYIAEAETILNGGTPVHERELQAA